MSAPGPPEEGTHRAALTAVFPSHSSGSHKVMVLAGLVSPEASLLGLQVTSHGGVCGCVCSLLTRTSIRLN